MLSKLLGSKNLKILSVRLPFSGPLLRDSRLFWGTSCFYLWASLMSAASASSLLLADEQKTQGATILSFPGP